MEDIEVSPTRAWELLSRHEKATLVDVRTDAEWKYVGEPSLVAVPAKLLKLSWRLPPDMLENPDFLPRLRQSTEPDSMLFFLCRSGGRSLAAARAAKAAGYCGSYSIAGGFEGAIDPHGHRGALAGWKHDRLPWVQT